MKKEINWKLWEACERFLQNKSGKIQLLKSEEINAINQKLEEVTLNLLEIQAFLNCVRETEDTAVY